MQFKTLVLIAGLSGASLASADNDPYLWLEGVDDEKALDWYAYFQDIIDHCTWEPDNIYCLYCSLKRRLSSQGQLVGQEYFEGLQMVQQFGYT